MERTKLVCATCSGDGSCPELGPCPNCNASGYRSGQIASAGYDEATATLEVEFRRGRAGIAPVWQYAPVDREVYDAILDPEQSAGRIFSGRVKGALGVHATRMADAEIVPA